MAIQETEGRGRAESKAQKMIREQSRGQRHRRRSGRLCITDPGSKFRTEVESRGQGKRQMQQYGKRWGSWGSRGMIKGDKLGNRKMVKQSTGQDKEQAIV